MESPTHHRIAALVVAVVAALALARTAPTPVVPPPVAPRELAPARIDPRTADARALDRLPGVGPALARRIVEARARGLVIRRPEDLLRVRGIGPATLARMRPMLELSGRGAAAPPRSP